MNNALLRSIAFTTAVIITCTCLGQTTTPHKPPKYQGKLQRKRKSAIKRKNIQKQDVTTKKAVCAKCAAQKTTCEACAAVEKKEEKKLPPVAYEKDYPAIFANLPDEYKQAIIDYLKSTGFFKSETTLKDSLKNAIDDEMYKRKLRWGAIGFKEGLISKVAPYAAKRLGDIDLPNVWFKLGMLKGTRPEDQTLANFIQANDFQKQIIAKKLASLYTIYLMPKEEDLEDVLIDLFRAIKQSPDMQNDIYAIHIATGSDAALAAQNLPRITILTSATKEATQRTLNDLYQLFKDVEGSGQIVPFCEKITDLIVYTQGKIADRTNNATYFEPNGIFYKTDFIKDVKADDHRLADPSKVTAIKIPIPSDQKSIVIQPYERITEPEEAIKHLKELQLAIAKDDKKIDEAIGAIHKWLVSQNYMIRDAAHALAKDLFAKNKGFDDAIEAAQDGAENDNTEVQNLALEVFTLLLRYDKAESEDEAFDALVLVINKQGVTITSIRIMALFWALAHKIDANKEKLTELATKLVDLVDKKPELKNRINEASPAYKEIFEKIRKFVADKKTK
jgi:hypothetical protein